MSYTISGDFVPITVNMPFTFEVDSIEAELFGEQIDLSGDIIDVMQPISLNALYDASGQHAWLHYIQGDDEDNFNVYVDQVKAGQLLDTIKDKTNYTAGKTYDEDNAGTQVIDASGVFDDVSDTWNYYNSVHDFVISWFAFKIFGHPGALAAISNDSYLRSQYTSVFDTGMEAIKGGNGAAIDDVSALTDTTENTVVANVIQSGQPSNGMSGEDLRMIVQQMMSMNPGRFTNNADRGFLRPVPWVENDIIQVQMRMQNCSFKVAANSPDGTTTRTPKTGQYITSASTGQLLGNDYILRFHVGPAPN